MKSFHHTVIYLGRMAVAAVAFVAALMSQSHALVPPDARFTTAPVISRNIIHTHPSMFGVTGGSDRFTSRNDFPSPFSITSFVVTQLSGSPALVAGVDGRAGGASIANSFSLGSLAPLAYQLGISSFGLDIADYSGLLRAAAPIAPIQQPEIWATILVAVGLIGMHLRRKSRLDSARHFA